MARIDELRLMTKVAHLYYNQDMTQPEIATQLDLSQATVSRLLKRAKQEQIVRVTVNVPYGVYAELEEQLQKTYGLKEVVIVDSVEHSDQILRDIGSAAAYYLETTLRTGDVIGVSSWSTTLLAMVDALQPLARAPQIRVLQILGGLGSPSAEVYASRLVLDMLRAAGAVGDICLRFFDASGAPVVTPLNDRVIGMDLDQLRQVKRAVGIAGGKQKLSAIRGALRGKLINVLITDHFTAQHLL